MVHHPAHVPLGGLHEQVVMIAHEHIAVKPEAVFVLRFLQVRFESVIVRFGEEDSLALVPTSGDVVEGSRVLDAKGSGHAASLSSEVVQCQDLTLILI